MKKIISFILLAICSNLYSNTNKSASYNGNTGVLETPNARILDDWSMRAFINQDKPFTYFGTTITPLPFLEANFHVTRVHGVSGFSDAPGYGSRKDKSLSFKIQLNNESKYIPAVVFGVDDVWGTALYTSKYFVASKNVGYFDLSLGYAKGRLGGEDLSKYNTNGNSGSFDNNALNFLKNRDWGGGKPFGSIVFNINPKLEFISEYSSIDYMKDKINPFSVNSNFKKPASKMNYGIKYKFSPNNIFTASFQRGNTLSFGYTYQFSFSGKGIFPKYPDPKWKASKEKKKEYENINDEKILSEKISKEVAAEKFRNVKASIHKNKIWLEINNNRYNNDLKAVGRAISTVDEVAPNKYNTIYATLKNKELPLKTFKINRTEFDMYENEKVSDDYIKKALVISNDVEKRYNEFTENKENYISNSKNVKNFSYNLGVKMRSYLNKKEKPLALKFTVKASATYDLTDKISLNTSFEHPFYNQGKDLPVEPLEDERKSIRSNFMEHFKYNGTQMSYLSAIYKSRVPYSSFFKAELGYLEYSYAGLDLEWYKPMFDEKFGVGLQYQNVYKREVEDLTKFKKDYNYTTNFLNLYYLASPKYDIHVGAKIGKFLAGDKGIKLDVSRHYKGFTLGAFASFTNSKEVFNNPKNQGHIDKGFYLKIPFDVFAVKHMKKRVSFPINAWTRDTAQFSGTKESLFPMNNSENNIQIMKKNIYKLKE